MQPFVLTEDELIDTGEEFMDVIDFLLAMLSQQGIDTNTVINAAEAENMPKAKLELLEIAVEYFKDGDN